MDITQLKNTVRYLDQLADLTMPGNIAVSSHIILKETDGATIMDERHYGDFSGVIRLDLTDHLAQYAEPTPGGDEFDASQELDLTLSVNDVEYPFTLVLLHSASVLRLSEIDMLRIPDRPFPLQIFFPLPRNLYRYEGAMTTMGGKLVYTAQERGILHRSVDPAAFAKSPEGSFRLTYRSQYPADNWEKVTPVYKVTPGEFQLYLFRNKLGLLEYFPMSGAFSMNPSYEFEGARYGKMYRKASASCSMVMTQYTGPLTRKASQVLAKMLEDGYAFHWNGSAWKRIIIEDAVVAVKSTDSVQFQNFSFRYQDPLDPADIAI